MEKKIKRQCCICGCMFTGWGNNPWPVVDDPDEECCNDCNAEIVLPARLDKMFGGGNKKCQETP